MTNRLMSLLSNHCYCSTKYYSLMLNSLKINMMTNQKCFSNFSVLGIPQTGIMSSWFKCSRYSRKLPFKLSLNKYENVEIVLGYIAITYENWHLCGPRNRSN